MRVYLADLFHTAHASPYTIPLGIGYLAATLKRHLPHLEIRLFRDPDRFLKAVRLRPPHVCGFSFCAWNTDLTRRAMERVLDTAPHAVIVAGGPCIDDTDDQILEFFEENPQVRYVVPGEGEIGITALLQHLLNPQRRADSIPGVAWQDDGGSLQRGVYAKADVEMEIPSPYLDGTLDEFLVEGLVPILQTMRGCPYRCEFCVSGTTLWNRPRGFPLERVKAEIDYVLERGSSRDLILTDENWGLLGQRDVEVAEFIMQRRHALGRPSRLYYYTAKIVNDASRAIVEKVAPIAWIGEFTMSFQSLNPQTRKTIKRTNIPLHKLGDNIAWARERNIRTSSEMIYGFPYETVDTFLDGIQTLMTAGVDRINVFPLLLFPGIDLASKTAREKYCLKTRFRMAYGCYGVYDEGTLVSVETDQLVVGTHCSDLRDYLRVRRYVLFHQILVGREGFKEFMDLCEAAGVPAPRLIREVSEADYANAPALQAILSAYEEDVKAELMPTREAVYDAFKPSLLRGEGGSVKIIPLYLIRVISSTEAIAELTRGVESVLLGKLPPGPTLNALRIYLSEVLPHRMVILGAGADATRTFTTRFDYRTWRSGEFEDVAQLLLPAPQTFTAVTTDDIQNNFVQWWWEQAIW